MNDDGGGSGAFSVIIGGAEGVLSRILQSQVHDDEDALDGLVQSIRMPDLELVRMLDGSAGFEPSTSRSRVLQQLNHQPGIREGDGCIFRTR